MPRPSFFREVEISGEKVEVEVSAHVYFGPGGPDPSGVEDTLVKRVDSGADVTDLVEPKVLEEIEAELFEAAYDWQSEDD